VWLQVLVQAREDLIERTVESLIGAKRVIIHMYNSTSPAQRRVVFGKSKDEIKAIAVNGARMIKDRLHRLTAGGTEVMLQYSPESFSMTEVEYAKEISEAVMDVWQPTPQHKMILNLPDTVEVAMPNVYADQIEWMCKNIKNRDSLIISLHTHNDRCTGVAATELGMLAGADRVEGTLFGNGERTGNLDIVTVALNLYMHGIDPKLDFSNLAAIIDVYERSTGMTVPPRQPYAGELVFTAFSGSHQDAINKGLTAYFFENFWEWLKSKKRTIETLGGRSEFSIEASDIKGTVTSSKGTSNRFTKKEAEAVWNRYYKLPENKKHEAQQYALGIFAESTNKTCPPWIAAAIRDFEDIFEFLRANPSNVIWDVPYLTIDPKDIGREYREVIRANSQSGKGGVAYLLESEFGISLPKDMQREFGPIANDAVDKLGREVSGAELKAMFWKEYVERVSPWKLGTFETMSKNGIVNCNASLFYGSEQVQRSLTGNGNGPLAALVHGFGNIGVQFEISNYSEHALSSGETAAAIAYIQIKSADGKSRWGAGVDTNIELASVRAVLSALNRLA
jgi:isopropylmalate/homocitrate/citramalate synthase